MTNQAIQISVQQRLNKLASNDYDNIEAWQVMEAFNKVQLEWCRTQLHGGNAYREGQEQSTRRVDDLQCLLVKFPLEGQHQGDYFISGNMPADYLQMSHVSAFGWNEKCEAIRKLKVFPAEDANSDDYDRDENKRPSWDWAETFYTLVGNRVQIAVKDFRIVQAVLHHYRYPRYVMFEGAVDIATGAVVASDVECEFKNDIVAILIDMTVAVLSGDTADVLNVQRSSQNAEKTN